MEAEQAVLGGLMLDNEAWDAVADRLCEADFYRHDHRLIFRAIGELAARNSPFDLVTLSERLESRGELDDAGGLAYLGLLAKDTPSAANIRAYADIVRERSVLRQLISVGTEIADSGFNPEGRESRELLDTAEQKVFEIAEQGARSQQGFRSMRVLLRNTVEHIEMLYERDDPITGLPTGYSEFDEMTSGLQGGDLVIVAGRPSMGKTSFAMNIAEYAALKQQARWRCSAWRCPASSCPCVCSPPWAASTSSACAPGAWKTTTGRASPAPCPCSPRHSSTSTTARPCRPRKCAPAPGA